MADKNSTPIYKKWWFWVIIVVVIVAVGGGIGASQGDKAEKIGESSSSTTGTDDTAKSEPAQTTFKVGDVISYDNKEIVVSDVVRNYDSGNQYITPSDGKEYVKVTVSITNKSDKKADYNAYDWKMEDSTGDIKSYTYVSDDNALNSGDLAAGGTKVGTIVYEVPAGDAGLKLHYQPNMFLDDKEIVIELQ